MSSSETRALHHIESHILSWKNLGIRREELLRKINDIVMEFNRSSSDLGQSNHCNFVSMQSLKGYNTVCQCKLGLLALGKHFHFVDNFILNEQGVHLLVVRFFGLHKPIVTPVY